MSIVRAFQAVRPTPALAEKVAALPYDVMNSDEARQMVVGNPWSFLHVDKAEIDLDPSIDLYDTRVYEKARDNLNQMVADGVFIQDDKPCLYIYKQVMNGRAQIGIVGCTSIDEYMEGTIKKLKAFNSLWGQTPTIALAKDAMEAIIKENTNSAITPAVVIDHVARYHNITVEQLKGKKKDAPIVKPRQQAMYLIRDLTNLSLPEIGNALGGKNHTTVLHSIKKVEDEMKKDPAIAKTIAELTENIKKSY